MYTLEKWIEYHSKGVNPKNYRAEYEKWLKWRLSVDRGETRSSTMLIIGADVGYESPTTGEHITSDKQRREDLAKSECVEYEPGMKQDYQRRVKSEEAALDKEVDENIDRAIATLPPEKLKKLEQEIVGGATAEIARETV